jgi:hypothetical protein
VAAISNTGEALEADAPNFSTLELLTVFTLNRGVSFDDFDSFEAFESLSKSLSLS